MLTSEICYKQSSPAYDHNHQYNNNDPVRLLYTFTGVGHTHWNNRIKYAYLSVKSLHIICIYISVKYLHEKYK